MPALRISYLAFPIELSQTTEGFTVTYGQQINSGLTYKAAAENIGYSIMHALAVDGLIENEETESCIS